MASLKNFIVIVSIVLFSGSTGACLDKEGPNVENKSVPPHVLNMKIENIITMKINAVKEVLLPISNYKSKSFDTVHKLEFNNSNYQIH